MTDPHIIQLHVIKISFCNDNIKCKVERLFCLNVYHSNLNDIQKLDNKINFRNLPGQILKCDLATQLSSIN